MMRQNSKHPVIHPLLIIQNLKFLSFYVGKKTNFKNHVIWQLHYIFGTLFKTTNSGKLKISVTPELISHKEHLHI